MIPQPCPLVKGFTRKYYCMPSNEKSVLLYQLFVKENCVTLQVHEFGCEKSVRVSDIKGKGWGGFVGGWVFTYG